MATREALASAFQNIYAEGYPDEDSRLMTEEEILDYPARRAHYRRNGDPRYYKGVEYADAVEALAPHAFRSDHGSGAWRGRKCDPYLAWQVTVTFAKHPVGKGDSHFFFWGGVSLNPY